jgi:hypothetical protein
MYEEHQNFERPGSPEAKIWRYSDLGKFICTLCTGSLWFSRIDQFDDKYEASWLPYVPPAGRAGPAPQVFEDNRRRIWPASVSTTAVNCWHMNEWESDAMWKLYGGGTGVAIQSTFARLTASLKDCPHFVSVGLVKYIDYTSDTFVGQDNGFQPFLHKRKSYEHEKELRAVVWPPGGEHGTMAPIDKGIRGPVSLDRLIERVYLAPDAPPSLMGDIKDAMAESRVSFEVIQSDIHQRPLY